MTNNLETRAGLLTSFRAWLAQLPYTDPIKRRLAPVLQLFFVSLIAILAFAIFLSLLISGLSVEALVGLIPAFIFGAALVVGLTVLRRGFFNWGVAIIIVALLLNQLRSFIINGFYFNQQNLVISAIPLMLAAFLLGRRWMLLVALAIFLPITVIAFQEQAALTAEELANRVSTPIARLTSFGLLLPLILVLLDQLAQTFRGELAASIRHGQELEAEIEARKAAQQSLAQQREQYHVTLASIGDAVIATDTAGQVTFLNEIAADLTGWPVEEALGKPLNQVFPIRNEYTLEPVENPLTRVLAEGVIVGLANHTVLVQRDGTSVPIADSGAPIRDEAGQVIGAVLVFRDVTEERRAEAELKESEARFRVMADSAPVLIWMAGDDRAYNYFNKGWLNFTGRTLEQEQGDGWLEGIHPDDRDRCRETYATAFEQREPFTLEYRLRRADGSYRWVINNGDPRLLDDGSFAGYIGSCIDIHERKEAEARTELLQKLTAALASTVTIEEVSEAVEAEGFAMLDAHLGVIALLNDDKRTISHLVQFGVPAELMRPYETLPIDASTPVSDAIRERKAVWTESLADFQGRYPELAAYIQSSDSRIQSNATVPLTINRAVIGAISISFPYPQQWNDDRRAFFTAVAQQCAQAIERARLHRQAQLTAALEERQRLARELHDAVSQTLFSATIIAESLPAIWQRDTARGGEQAQQLVVLNRAAMSEMRALLLELRPEAILKTDLKTLLTQLVEAAKGRKNFQVRVEISDADAGSLPPNVHVALYRIAQESINNILKHSQADAFSLRLAAAAAAAQLQISDNGVGFDPAHLSPGLGLNNIRERAESIDAAVDITSQPGGGTTITVTWRRK